MDPADLEGALDALGQIMADRQLAYEIVMVGGGSLGLTGQIVRPTEDLDVVAFVSAGELASAEPFPDALRTAVSDVAGLVGLRADWLNSGPASLLDLGLPGGFLDRTSVQRYGPLVVRHAGRFDQICFKLYAAVDQGPRSKHARDLAKLQATSAELAEAAAWTRTHDPSDDFKDQLRQALTMFGAGDVEL